MIGIALIGKSVAFELKDGSTSLVKVQGVRFDEKKKFTGIDDEGMNVTIEMDQIDTYTIPGSGEIKSEIV